MRIKLFTLTLLLTSATASAFCGMTATNNIANDAQPPKAYRNAFLNKTGGMVLRPGVKQGVIAIINGQSKLSCTNFNIISKTFERVLHVQMPIIDLEKKLLTPKEFNDAYQTSKADFAVIVVDNPECDVALCIFPEKKYSIINIAPLEHDCRSNAFLISRTRKEVLRGLLYVIGGASSGSLLNVMGPIYSNADLDKIADETIPVDVLARTMNYLPASGCETHAYVPYRKAVVEGWAAAPTNDYQQAIWDRVHTLPTEPLKIKPETKKQEK